MVAVQVRRLPEIRQILVRPRRNHHEQGPCAAADQPQGRRPAESPCLKTEI